jgi:ketosteroid isomerase-like protein
MSEENVEIMRRSFDLWNRGDLEGWLETLDHRGPVGAESDSLKQKALD